MSTGTSEQLVITRRDGAIQHVTLNRPRAINALNSEMFLALHEALQTAGDSTAIYLDGAGDRGFCGGGDIKHIASHADPHGIFRLEYGLNYEISESPVPVVAIMDGITMGGGIGLGGHAAYRIVTERSRLAMPETRIGLAPDVGGHLLLAGSPGRLGEYLALTSTEMNAGDALAFGFADHYVPSARLDELRAALAAGTHPDDAIAAVAEPGPESPLTAVRDWFDAIADEAFGDDTQTVEDPAAAAVRLISALEAHGNGDTHASAAASTIREMCPVSIAVTLSQIARTRSGALTLAEVLEDDFRIIPRVAVHGNFAEGVRAQLIDKDRNPKWNPARIEDLDGDVIAELLAPHRPDEETLGLPQQ